MSYTDRWMDAAGELPEPDPAAFSDPDTHEVDDDWLAKAAPEEQMKAMRLWFLARYCDPQEETPYASDAGGYLWVNGGPYDPSDVLQDRFDSMVEFDTIWKLVEEFHDEVGDEWAPTSLTAEHNWDDVFVDTASGPLTRLRERLDELRTLAGLDGPPMSRILLRQLVYAAVVTALETFLWELAAYWLESDLDSVDRLVSGQPRYSQRLENLGGDTSENRAKLCDEIHDELKGKVWHRWEKTGPFLAQLLGVAIPSHEPLEQPTRIRHDIAHRGGKDTDHNPVNLTQEDVEALFTTVLGFAETLQASIDSRS